MLNKKDLLSASVMKVLVITLVCALAGIVCGGAAPWPNAALALRTPLLNTIIPAQTKSFGYSTTQYINSLPASYTLGLPPQFAYQVPQPVGLQPAYYPVAGLQYYPASVFYPTVGSVLPGVPSTPVVPSAPAAPSQPSNTPVEQPAGDADTAVIDSADISSDQQRQDQPPIAQTQPQTVSFPPANIFPNFPSFPQFPQGAGQIPFPQLPENIIPQLPENIVPQLPQFPGGLFPQRPQLSQGTVPQSPQLPQGVPTQFPQIPSNTLFPQSPVGSSPSTFPGSTGGDKGLNDEDTISVDSI